MNNNDETVSIYTCIQMFTNDVSYVRSDIHNLHVCANNAGFVIIATFWGWRVDGKETAPYFIVEKFQAHDTKLSKQNLKSNISKRMFCL